MKPDKQTLCAIKKVENKILGITYRSVTTYAEESIIDEILQLLKEMKP
jgi:hypothetical protein